MASRIAQVVIAAVDPEVISRFWCDVLGWAEFERDGDDEVICIGPADSGSGIDVLRVPNPRTQQNRLHIDLRADDVATADEVERLLALGARRVDVGQPAGASWTVLADPEGNEFCLLGRTVQEAAG